MFAMLLSAVGCVVIGRNEGERLAVCLDSVLRHGIRVVYVDSGSTDDSQSLARSRGVQVLELDDVQPFTAARGRNAGAYYLARMVPGIEFVQFVDGDCELVPEWLEPATARLRERSDLAAVCGRVRERSPERSIYNRLCDIEWNTPVGEALACGGNAMMRLAALQDVGGFNPQLIAGEEPELCVRLRRAGYRIERLDADMVLHDAAMTRFEQWWRRSVRAGHAYAEGASMHGASAERHWVSETRRIWFWGAALPSIVLASALSTRGGTAILLWVYPFFATRVYSGMRRRGFSRYEALLYSAFLTLGRFAELQGMLKYHLRRMRGETPRLIEYKRAATH
jgi:GT2 family glycosyltransferase